MKVDEKVEDSAPILMEGVGQDDREQTIDKGQTQLPNPKNLVRN